MQHTEEQIKKIVETLLTDIKRDYRTDRRIVIRFEAQETLPYSSETIIGCWTVGVPVDDEQFGHQDGSSILIFIEDSTGDIKGYLDNGAGRPVQMKATKSVSGKYSLEPAGN